MMKNIINLSCSLSSLDNPWSLIGQAYTDIIFIIGGKKHHYHQAILAQHSSMFRDIFAMARCCKCLGFECMHETKELLITLDNVEEEVFKVVMEIVYDGCGKVPDDVEEFKSIVNMLNLDSLFIRDKKDNNGNKQIEDHVEQEALGEHTEIMCGEPLPTFDSQFFTNDVGDIAELKLSNMLSDTIDTFEDENFSVTVQEIQTDIPDEDHQVSVNRNLFEDQIKAVDNIISENMKVRKDEDDSEINDYNYDDSDEIASEVSDEHSSEEYASDDEIQNEKKTKENIENETEEKKDNSLDRKQDDISEERKQDDISEERKQDDISDDDDINIIDIIDNKPVKTEDTSFNIRNHILQGQSNIGEPKKELIQSSQKDRSSTRKLLEKLDQNNLSIIVKEANKDEKMLVEDNHENQLEDTLSEFTSLLRRKNSKVEQDLVKSMMEKEKSTMEKEKSTVEKEKSMVEKEKSMVEKEKSIVEKEESSKSRTDVEKKVSNARVVYHCPFENCSYSNKRAVDFHTHIGAKHYRTKIQQLYPNFIHKHCDQCNKTFSVTSNYYSHMAKHENFPYMNKSDISSLGRVDGGEESKPKEEDTSNDSYYEDHFLDAFTVATVKEKRESETKFADETFSDDDDIIEISPPKRKSPSRMAENCKKSRGSFY